MNSMQIKKALINSLIFLLIFSCVSCSTNSPSIHKTNSLSASSKEKSSYANVISLYSEFLAGKIIATDKDGNKVSLSDVYQSFTNPDNHYAYFDMNGDSLPELLCRSSPDFVILTVKNGKVVVWAYQSCFFNVLENHQGMYILENGGPPHTIYKYYTFDFDGNCTSTPFYTVSNPSPNEYEYYSEGKQITKAEWEDSFAKYLTIPLAKIDWNPFSKKS